MAENERSNYESLSSLVVKWNIAITSCSIASEYNASGEVILIQLS